MIIFIKYTNNFVHVCTRLYAVLDAVIVIFCVNANSPHDILQEKKNVWKKLNNELNLWPPFFLPLLGQVSPDADISKRGSPFSESLHDVGKVKYESFGYPERRSLPAFYWKRPSCSTYTSVPHISQTIESLCGMYLYCRIGNTWWGQKCWSGITLYKWIYLLLPKVYNIIWAALNFLFCLAVIVQTLPVRQFPVNILIHNSLHSDTFIQIDFQYIQGVLCSLVITPISLMMLA